MTKLTYSDKSKLYLPKQIVPDCPECIRLKALEKGLIVCPVCKKNHCEKGSK